MAQEVHGMTRRQGGSVVTNDWHAVPDVIASPGVCAAVVPTSAFIDVAIRTNHKAEGTKIVQHMINECSVQ